MGFVSKKALAMVVCASIMSAAMSFGQARAEETIDMTVTAGHPPVFLWVQLLDGFFLPEVDRRLAASGGNVKVNWTKAYGGTLAKIGGELDAIRDGISDVGFVGTIFHAPQMPLQNVSYFAPFGSSDVGTVSNIIADLQSEIPEMKAAWTKNNQVYLGGAALDTYHLFTNFPVNSLEDLKGKRIMAPGPSANWINGTGAVAVASSLPEYYNNIKTGVADGVVTFTTGALPTKLFEVAPYMTEVNFGSQFAGGLTINKDRFDALPEDVQQIFMEVGAAFSKEFADAQTAKAAAFLEKMKSAGLKVSSLSNSDRNTWANTIPNAGKKWADSLDEKGLPGSKVLTGYMKAIKESGADVPRDWSAE